MKARAAITINTAPCFSPEFWVVMSPLLLVRSTAVHRMRRLTRRPATPRRPLPPINLRRRLIGRRLDEAQALWDRAAGQRAAAEIVRSAESDLLLPLPGPPVAVLDGREEIGDVEVEERGLLDIGRVPGHRQDR